MSAPLLVSIIVAMQVHGIGQSFTNWEERQPIHQIYVTPDHKLENEVIRGDIRAVFPIS